MGDRPAAKNVATETASVDSTNASTQIQTPEVKRSPEPATQKPIESFFKKPEMNALFVSDTITDGQKVEPETVIEQTWKLYNPGPCAWPVGCSVRFIGGDDMFNVSREHPSSVDTLTAAMESNVLRDEIAPGKAADFSIQLKTPKREGTAVSYWRLKTAEGLGFGHKLWCDVRVNATSPVKEESPSSIGDEVKEESKVASASEGSSTMIFPKLEKESPSSSTHDVTEGGSAEAVEPPAPKVEEQDLVDDIESLELDEDDDTDAGFLTDEEYDILDASDEDFLLAEAENATNKK